MNCHSLNEKNKLTSKPSQYHPKLASQDGPAERFPWPIVSDEIKSNVEQALSDGSWGQYEGRWTDELTATLRREFKTQQVALCSSGTIAVELALRGAGVKPGDEVILAGYDFPGNFRAIEAIGAKPVLIDVVEGGWVIDANHVQAALSDLTSAIIVSHLHGQVADINSIRQIIERHDSSPDQKITLVEDACQVPGAWLGGAPLGSLGDVAALSFGGSKLLSAGRGGAVLTNSPEIHQRVKIFAQRGNDAFPLSQLQAAVLIPQFATLAAMNQTRNQNAQILIDRTNQVETLGALEQLDNLDDSQNVNTAFYKLPWLLKDLPVRQTREEIIASLIAEGLPAGAGFRGFLRRSARRCRKIGPLAHSQIAAQQTVLLAHPLLLQPESVIDQAAKAIEKVLDQKR